MAVIDRDVHEFQLPEGTGPSRRGAGDGRASLRGCNRRHGATETPNRVARSVLVRGLRRLWRAFRFRKGCSHVRPATSALLPPGRSHRRCIEERRRPVPVPNLWWPDDRAWCVATELDMQSTYIGGSRACVDQLLGDDRLEVYEVQPSDGISWDADGVNPKPDEPHPWDISSLEGWRPRFRTDTWHRGLGGWRSRRLNGDSTLGVAGARQAVRKLPGWTPVRLPRPLIKKIQSWNEYRMGVWRVQILLKDGRIFRPVYIAGDDVTKIGPAGGPFAPIPFSRDEIEDILKDPDWSD